MMKKLLLHIIGLIGIIGLAWVFRYRIVAVIIWLILK